MLGEGTRMLDISTNSVGADLVSARVSENQSGFITTGGHKVLPYDVMAVLSSGDR
jgi:hypothetical protein